jgi:serine/threonine protein kinase
VNESKLWIVTPYMSVGSCLDLLKHYFKDGMDEKFIQIVLYQALLGLDYLHKNGHIHRYCYKPSPACMNDYIVEM